VSATERKPILELTDVHTFYGSIEALKGISLEVYEGEVVTLIGSNGAGKSTTLRSINGLNHPREGTIVFQGEDITDEAPHDVVKKGISQSPEGRRLFSRMSVLENLQMGAFQRADRAGQREDMDRVFSLFPRLAERKSQKAGTLSGGEQQMVAIGRALMARPKLLMLDEPSMGLAPIFVEKIFEIVREINEQGTPILLVEQNALMALDTAHRGYVMETGTIVLADDAKALRQNEDVQKTQPVSDTNSGKYGGERRTPTRASFSTRPYASSSAGASACVGTRPSRRAAVASRHPATSTWPSRRSAG
jgi:branched-chain amino acid transport system ATP-binding protein